jgi:hypothetical protein
MGDGDGPFLLLRIIANGFAELDADLEAIGGSVRIAGRSAIPLLCRELGGRCDRRRGIARQLVRAVDAEHRDRLIDALHAVARGPACDAGKAAALGALAELGIEPATASFADPRDVQRRSAAQLAAHLETRADVASAADLLVHELDTDDLINVVEAMADAAPARTTQLVAELSARLDLDGAVRSELRRIVAPLAIDGAAGGRSPGSTGRPAVLALLEDGDGRRVVLVSRRAGACWRNFAALIDLTGVLLDCLYEDETTPDVLERDVIGTLLDEGYARRPATMATARLVVAAAARRAAASARGLPSTYYLGRDLLGLGDVHLGQRARASELATLHGRAVDLLAGGDAVRARPLLEHCARIAPDDPDVASSLGLCVLAVAGDDADAIAAAHAHLARAAALEPSWGLHHWNLASACHRAGDLAACWRALRDFVATAGGGLGDPAHAERLAVAHRFVTDFERAAHLAGQRLPERRARRRRHAKPRPA